MAKQNTKKYLPDLIPPTTIMEVVKFNSRTGEFIGMKVMSHGEFKSMVKQPSFRYQEFQRGFSQFNK